MKFLANFLFSLCIVFFTSCITYQNHQDVSKSPSCSSIIRDFYDQVDKNNLIFGVPLVYDFATIYAAIYPNTPEKIKVLCLLPKTTVKEKTGCTKIGDIIGSCNVGLGDRELWYGQGEVDTSKINLENKS
jgi:hypothetical protein